MKIKSLFTLLSITLPAILLNSFYAQEFSCQAAKKNMLPPPYYAAENLRSDTFDILKYTIELEIGDFTSKTIKGHTQVNFVPKMNNQNFIRLDLLKLTVDSVKENNNKLTFTYNDTVLKVNFASTKGITDNSTITVYYQGQPQGDPSGWGGFYFDNHNGNQYAYNLGVGFAAKPHNYGRVWFPCFDNFVEHSKYEFIITTNVDRKAYCNGELVSDVVNGPNRTRTWKMDEEIPTYLASVAAAKYSQVTWSVNTLGGVKPIFLAAVPADTTSVKNGFVNLKNCVTGFENYYGEYKWNRVGYCMVPFNSGAMEHASNIAYPRAAAGSLSFEASLMAHELSHHWWGDLVTCETQEDMWINEGMATFSGYMFLEWQYGKNNYINTIKFEHASLLHLLHKKEGGFRAISGIPHNLTYSDHVYKKGADVAHTLRSYMGDTDFFNACKYVMQQKAYQNINSLELRDLMQTSSGKNLTDFFSNWVLAGGWPHFSIDSVKYINNGGVYSAVVSVQQKLYGAPNLYSNVPLELSFFTANRTRVIQTVTMSGSSSTFTLNNIPFLPVYTALNFDSKISDATSFENKRIITPGSLGYGLAKVSLSIDNAGNDTTLLRIIHSFVPPDPFKSNPKNHRLSNQHYWKVEGIIAPGFKTKARFNYDGSKTLGTYGYLDTLLTQVNGDSIRLFYRANAAADWELVMNVFKFESGAVTGFIEVDSLKLGEYTFGNSSDTTNIVHIKPSFSNKIQAQIYPNPAKNHLKIKLNNASGKKYAFNIMDIEGRILDEWESNESMINKNTGHLPEGIYFISATSEDKPVYCEKLIIVR